MKKVKSSSNRIVALDLMRGYFMIAILLNHLNIYPSGFEWVEMRGNLYVTAAEGFFFISGLVLGIVRGRKLIDMPMKKVTKILLGRGLKLYITSIILTLLFTFIGWQFMDNPGLKSYIISPDTNFFQLLWKTITFDYIYGWADYLKLYSLFMFASPIAMWLLRKGKWYVVMAISIILWLMVPAGITEMSDASKFAWQPLGWQLLFFGSMTIGFNVQNIKRWWQSLSGKVRRVIKVSVISLAAVTLVANILLVIASFDISGSIQQFFGPIQHDLYNAYFVKESLPLPRVLLFALWFTAAFFIVRRFEKQIVRYLGWLLLPFGMNSLYSYIVSSFVIFFENLFIGFGSVLQNFVVSLGSIAIVWTAIKTKFLMKIIPR